MEESEGAGRTRVVGDDALALWVEIRELASSPQGLSEISRQEYRVEVGPRNVGARKLR
jgi:hypothetical protein